MLRVPAQGPHFADWDAWHEQGGVSMAAVPVTTGGADSPVIGALSLACTLPAGFSEYTPHKINQQHRRRHLTFELGSQGMLRERVMRSSLQAD